MKEKGEIRDNYDLINSKAIGDYCRKIKYKFNTEELAVLVFRKKNEYKRKNRKVSRFN